jgi:plasmid stability protein
MATLTIRNLDDRIKRRLQIRAARNGRSMEAEVRALIITTIEAEPEKPLSEELDTGLLTAIHNLFTPLNVNSEESNPDELNVMMKKPPRPETELLVLNKRKA